MTDTTTAVNKINTYYKLDKKVDLLWEIYALEDDEVMAKIYLSHIHALYDTITTLISEMTDGEIRYIALLDGESSVQ